MTPSTIAYALPVRIVTAALLLASRGSLLVLTVLAFFIAEPITPARLLRAFWIFFLAPELAARILQYLFAAKVTVEDDGLVLELRSRRVEIPLTAIARIVPWRVPLPAPGFSLGLRSGARFSDGLYLNDPASLWVALRDAGATDLADQAARQPMLVYADARHRAASRWDRPLWKYVVFSLVPTVPLFRLRQLLTYGGAFGEYYDFGLKAYLLGFGIHWVLYAVYLLLYASVLRVLSEAVSLLAAWLAPSHAVAVRRAVEGLCRVLYYGGVPTVLILRFAAG
jgi:apolipoprotein N-acyltransferase